MERNIPCLLLILISFVLNAPSSTSGLSISKVVPISDLKSWRDAQSYCRAHHTDLVTIRNTQEAEQLVSLEGWIGLFLDENYRWRWSRGAEPASFTLWDSGESRVDVLITQYCAMKYPSRLSWVNHGCSNLHPFLCVDERLILVQEMKTWEAALVHCRQLKGVVSAAAVTTHLYDLASLPESYNLLLDGGTTWSNATEEVWVGLRYLAGQWLWVNGEAATSSNLPHCPAQQQHCGALSHSELSWKIMNCNEKRHFLCSI